MLYAAATAAAALDRTVTEALFGNQEGILTFCNHFIIGNSC